jgi:membrane protease subunit (stomatin/prohibitin family)
VDVTDNSKVTDWVSDLLLKVMRSDVTTQVVRNGWPVLGLSAYSAELERSVIVATNAQLGNYGVAMTRMGNFNINLSDEDRDRLKQLAKDTTYSQLAGGFNNYAAGQMALGAGQGMAEGGPAVGGAFLAAGLGMGNQLGGMPMQQQQPAPPVLPFGGNANPYAGGQPPAAVAPTAQHQQIAGPPVQDAGAPCPGCQTSTAPGARFCGNCGTQLAAAPGNCTACGTQLTPGARFCGNCGTPA